MIVALALGATLVLAFVPLRSVETQDERVMTYSVSVPSHNFGTEPIDHGFLDLCNAGASQLRLVGNQTVWLAWQVTAGNEPAYADLVAVPGGTPTSLYNATGVGEGGFAQTSSTELADVCASNPIFGAYSNSSLTIELQVGLIYAHSVTVAVA